MFQQPKPWYNMIQWYNCIQLWLEAFHIFSSSSHAQHPQVKLAWTFSTLGGQRDSNSLGAILRGWVDFSGTAEADARTSTCSKRTCQRIKHLLAGFKILWIVVFSCLRNRWRRYLMAWTPRLFFADRELFLSQPLALKEGIWLRGEPFRFKMLRVLLFFAGALASTFEDAHRLPFKGYCAKAPQAQHSGFPEAPPAHILQDGLQRKTNLEMLLLNASNH